MILLQSRCVAVLLAVGVAGIYFALVCASATCLFVHPTPLEGHDHHAQHSTHSPLCAWVCHGASEAGLVMGSPESSAWPVGLRALLLPSELSASPFSSLIHSRAPPSAPFVRVG
jgi:hypothetical protein